MEPSVLASFAVALLAFGVVSRRMERGVVSPPMVFLGLGFALGRLGWLDAGSGLVDGLTELTLVLVLFTDAARIDLAHLRLDGSLPARLLGVGLPLTVVAGALAAWMILPGLGLSEAVLFGAVLAPTDAALGQAVVSNPLVPVRIRQGLNVESGLNDGIALPAVLVAMPSRERRARPAVSATAPLRPAGRGGAGPGGGGAPAGRRASGPHPPRQLSAVGHWPGKRRVSRARRPAQSPQS